MGYGKGYYDRCCCGSMSTATGVKVWGILTIVSGVMSLFLSDILGACARISLGAMLAKAGSQTEKTLSKDRGTIKCAYIYNFVLTVLGIIASAAYFILLANGTFSQIEDAGLPFLVIMNYSVVIGTPLGLW